MDLYLALVITLIEFNIIIHLYFKCIFKQLFPEQLKAQGFINDITTVFITIEMLTAGFLILYNIIHHI